MRPQIPTTGAEPALACRQPEARLCSLPPELSHQIIGYLPASSIIALRSTCKYLLLTNAGGSESLEELYERVKQDPEDRFFVACRIESEDRSRVVRPCRNTGAADGEASQHRHYACRACMASHPSSWFDPAQLRNAPSDRKCRTVSLCPDAEMTLTQYRIIQKGVPLHGGHSTAPIAPCPGVHEHSSGIADCDSIGSTNKQGYLLWHQETNERLFLHTVWTLPLKALPQCVPADPGMTLEEQSHQQTHDYPDLDDLICPHLRVRDQLAWMLVRGLLVLLHSPGAKYFRCASCPTVVKVVFVNDHILLHSLRHFGEGVSPTDGSWLAQMGIAGGTWAPVLWPG